MSITTDSTEVMITEERKPLLLDNQTPIQQRLVSLDVFRGFTVLVCFSSPLSLFPHYLLILVICELNDFSIFLLINRLIYNVFMFYLLIMCF